MKLVINDCYGGFGLSKKEEAELKKLGYDNEDIYSFNYDISQRNNKDLIKVIEALGEKANEDGASLSVIELPDEITDYEIIMEEYGNEYVIYVLNGKIKHEY